MRLRKTVADQLNEAYGDIEPLYAEIVRLEEKYEKHGNQSLTQEEKLKLGEWWFKVNDWPD